MNIYMTGFSWEGVKKKDSSKEIVPVLPEPGTLKSIYYTKVGLPMKACSYGGFDRVHPKMKEDSMEKKFSIFLDSGAPSLYNTLVRSDKGAGHMGSYMGDRRHDDFSFIKTPEYLEYREKYIEFIKEHKDYIDVYANLDIINNAEATYKNQKYLESKGINPIPVFHLGTDISWLKRYLAEGYDYIALGGIVPNPPNVIIPILDDLFEKYLTDKDGYPLVKLHGFAVTSVKLVIRYPWWSVDSTSWVKFGKYGIVCVPRRKGGKYMYDESSWSVCVSNRSPSNKIPGKHISTFSGAERDLIFEYFAEKGYSLGRSEFKNVEPGYELQENERFIGKAADGLVETVIEKGLSNDYRLRDELNILYYLDLEKSQPEWPWPFKLKRKQKGFGFMKAFNNK